MKIVKILLIIVSLFLLVSLIQQLRGHFQDVRAMIPGVYKGDDSDEEPGNKAFETLSLHKNGTYQIETNVPSGNHVIKTTKNGLWEWDTTEFGGDLMLNSGGGVSPLWIKDNFLFFGPIQLCNGEDLTSCYEKQ